MGKEIYHAKEDPKYQSPYVDLEEDRERTLPDGTTLPYRYVHGGFGGTNVKFILCFPEKGEFKGRFYQYLSPFPGPDEELASVDKQGEDDIIAFCLKIGAYFVESNMGSKAMFGSDPEPERVYQSSAAVAEYSRTKAMEYYGCTRPYGYVYGGSGGGYKTMACIENTDAWDGALPYVIGSPVSLPNTIMLHVQGQRCLRRVFGKIVDALDAGGSGNMYEGLTENEAAMLREITDMGFPPEAWFLEAAGQIDDGSLQVLMPLIKMGDPGYFEDFWKVPGYLGTDPESSAVKDRLQFEGIVKSVHGPGSETDENAVDGRNDVNDAWQKMMTDGNGAWIELEEVPHGDLYLKGVNIISKQKLIMAGVIITCVGLFINFIAGSNMTLLMIGALLQNAGAVPISMLASLLIVDCAEYNEWKGMRRMEGTLGSVNGFASKVGGSLGTAFVGIMIGLAGYDASAAVMPDSALLMIRLLYSLIPLALYVVVFIAMGFYKVEKDMPQILKDNEEKRAAYLAEHPETENK